MQQAKVVLYILCFFCWSCTLPISDILESYDDNLPLNWSSVEGEGGSIASQWWKIYSDPNLQMYLQEILQDNPEVDIALSRLTASQESLGVASSSLYPHLSLNFDSTRRENKFIGLPIPGAENKILSTFSTSFSSGLGLSWELDLWGRVRALRNGASYSVMAEKNNYEAMVLSLIGTGIKKYYILISEIKKRDLSRKIVDIQASRLAFFQKRYEEGLVSLDQLLVMTSDFDRAKNGLIAIENELSNIEKSILVLAGKPPFGEVFQPSLDIFKINFSIPVGIPAELLNRRSDILIAKNELLSKNELLKAEQLNLLPKISLTSSGGTLTREYRDILDGDYRVWNIAANLTQPIFQGQKIASNIRLQQAKRNEALAKYTKVVLNALYEVESTLLTERALIEQRERVQNVLSSMERSASYNWEKYQAGVVNRETALKSRILYLQNKHELINLQTELLVNRINLHLALGGGFGETKG